MQSSRDLYHGNVKTGNTHMVKRADIRSYAFLTITNKVDMLPKLAVSMHSFIALKRINVLFILRSTHTLGF